MTTAAVAQPTGNQIAVLVALFLLVSFITCVALWVHERRWDKHDEHLWQHTEQLARLAGHLDALADFLEVDLTDPIPDDSPGHEAEMYDDAPTEEFDAIPETVPDGMPLAVQTALIERPRGADWVEAELARIRARIDAAREAS